MKDKKDNRHDIKSKHPEKISCDTVSEGTILQFYHPKNNS